MMERREADDRYDAAMATIHKVEHEQREAVADLEASLVRIAVQRHRRSEAPTLPSIPVLPLQAVR